LKFETPGIYRNGNFEKKLHWSATRRAARQQVRRGLAPGDRARRRRRTLLEKLSNPIHGTIGIYMIL